MKFWRELYKHCLENARLANVFIDYDIIMYRYYRYLKYHFITILIYGWYLSVFINIYYLMSILVTLFFLLYKSQIIVRYYYKLSISCQTNQV